jgi:hypothetical protein
VTDFVDAEFFDLLEISRFIESLFFEEADNSSSRINELLIGMSRLFIGREHAAIGVGVKVVQDLFGLLFVDGLFDLLDQAEDIAHPENAVGDPVRVEEFEGKGSAMTTARKALAAAPAHPEALTYIARLHLDAEAMPPMNHAKPKHNDS